MRKFISVFYFLCFLFIVISCSSGDDVLFEKYGKTIGSKGGKYIGVDDVSVIIPRGALEKNFDVMIISLDTPALTNISATISNIYFITPSAYKFKKNAQVTIPYNEEALGLSFDETMVKAYFSHDRSNFTEVSQDLIEFDYEENTVKISSDYLGYFHLGIPREEVKKENTESEGLGEMIYIPEGYFESSAPEGVVTGEVDANGQAITSPGLQSVFVSSFYIDKYEVSNAQYKVCLDAGVCTEPRELSSSKYPNYFYDIAYQNFPVINVSWNQANTFCQWADKQLPTEAQWEKAARGETFRKFPWGDEEPQDNAENAFVNYSALFGDVTDVTSFPKAVSVYNIYNMAGNVAEWTQNWHDTASYYTPVVLEDPEGPEAGHEKVIRGGSWVSLLDGISTYAREKAFPHYSYYNLGFRCVKNNN